MVKQQHSVVNQVRPFVTPNALMMMGLKQSLLPIPFIRRSPPPLPELTSEVPEDLDSEASTSKPKRAIASNIIYSKPVHGNAITNVLNNPVKKTSIEVTKEVEDVCNTPACVKTATAILENMDESVNPCDDFYQFTCGNFMKEEPIPDDKSSVTLMGSITDHLADQLRDILSEQNSNLSHSALLAKSLYDSCMDTGTLKIYANFVSIF